jgi:hypothetical protein
MKQFLALFVTLLLLQSCIPEAQNKILTYQNIIILSDLSDRIEPTINGCIPNQQYPSKDIKEIDIILKFFNDECVKPGEKIGDKSCILFSTFSNESIACIDIGKIKNLEAKQQFINSTGKYQNNGLKYKIGIFKKKVKNAYTKIRNKGLDLISVTIDKIENKSIVKKNTILTNGVDSTFINYDNHIYIFTDGYLEYKGKNLNNQFYFGNLEIEKIRHYCIANKVNIEKALKDNSSLCLPAVKNEKNQLINLHILETHERDKNVKLQNYKNPIGLRDNEILEAVWRKWATESNFKSFEWRKY